MLLSRLLPVTLCIAVLTLAIGFVGCGPEASVQTGQAGPADATLAAAEMVNRDELARMGLRQRWTDRLRLPAGDRVQQVALLGEQIVVVTEANYSYAVDTYTGDYRALAEVAPKQVGPFKTPYFDGFRFFFAGTNRLIGINAATGKTEIQIKLEVPSNVRAVSDREHVFTGASDGRIFTYSLESQQKHWEGKVGPAVISLQLCRGNVVAARSDVLRGRGEVFMIGARRWNDEPQWTRLTEGPISAPIVVSDPPDDAIFVASEDARLYRFNAVHGWDDWQVRMPAPLVDAPLVLSDVVIQRIQGSGTWAVERVGGEVRWKDPQVLQYLGQSKDNTRMYFFDGQNLIAKKPQDGKTLGTLAVNGKDVMTVPNQNGTRLYLVDATGNMVCLDESRLPYQAVE